MQNEKILLTSNLYVYGLNTFILLSVDKLQMVGMDDEFYTVYEEI